MVSASDLSKQRLLDALHTRSLTETALRSIYSLPTMWVRNPPIPIKFGFRVACLKKSDPPGCSGSAGIPLG
jgi:hypothetical protein